MQGRSWFSCFTSSIEPIDWARCYARRSFSNEFGFVIFSRNGSEVGLTGQMRKHAFPSSLVTQVKLERLNEVLISCSLREDEPRNRQNNLACSPTGSDCSRHSRYPDSRGRSLPCRIRWSTQCRTQSTRRVCRVRPTPKRAHEHHRADRTEAFQLPMHTLWRCGTAARQTYVLRCACFLPLACDLCLLG